MLNRRRTDVPAQWEPNFYHGAGTLAESDSPAMATSNPASYVSEGHFTADGRTSPSPHELESRANLKAAKNNAGNQLESIEPIASSLPARSTPLSPSVVSGVIGLSDCVSVLGTGAVIYLLYLGWGVDPLHVYVSALVIASSLIITAFYFVKLYEFQSIVNPGQQLKRILLVCGTVFLLLVTLAFALKISEEISRVWSFSTLIIATILICTLRWYGYLILRRLANAGLLSRNVAIVGTGEQAEKLLQHLERADEPWIRIVGIFDDRIVDAEVEYMGHRILGNIGDLQVFSLKHRIDDVIVTLPWNAEQRLTEIVGRLQELPVHIRLGSDLIGYAYPHRTWSSIGEVLLLDIFQKPLSGWKYVAKYLEDKLVATVLLALFGPLMILIAVVVKLDSRGPVLFRQIRYGFNNSKFSVFKFRTMYADPAFASGSKQAKRDDSRVTRVGRILRRLSLDELPQLFNVLQGTMSLVGPRPHPIPLDDEYARLIKRHFARYRVKPGMTGWAQIKGLRGETSIPDRMKARVEHDLYYIENWSIFFDLRILLSTVVIMLTQKNAY